MPERLGRVEDGCELPYLVWRLAAPARMVSSAVLGGGLVNLVATATEAKTQALLDLGIPGTGTATDAVCIAAALDGVPVPARAEGGAPVAAGADGDADPFGGPRSSWGARLARAVHAAVRAGTADSLERMGGSGR